MAEKEIYIPHDWCSEILSNEAECRAEGVGGRMDEVLSWIASRYPDLRELYAHRVDWPISDQIPRP